jgi:hypothetical protein
MSVVCTWVTNTRTKISAAVQWLNRQPVEVAKERVWDVMEHNAAAAAAAAAAMIRVNGRIAGAGGGQARRMAKISSSV